MLEGKGAVAGLASSDATGETLRDHQLALARVAEEVARADLRNFRTLAGDRDWQGIVARASLPVAVRLTDESIGLVGHLLSHCSRVQGPRAGTSSLPPALLSFERAMDSTVDGLVVVKADLGAVEDVAFLVQMELRQRRDRLARLVPRSDPRAILGECDGALRRIRKGLGAIDAALVAAGEGPPAVAFTTELADSLTVRAAYGRFRSFITQVEPPTEATIESSMRLAKSRIERLTDGPVAPLLRVRDRLELLELEGRVRAWLQATAFDAQAGLRLWQDITGVVEMFGQVNRRQELMEHDHVTLTSLLRAIQLEGRLATPQEVMLRALSGLDPELDRVLWSTPLRYDQATPIVVELARCLGVREARP